MIEQHINQNSMLSIGSILRGIYRIDRYLSSGGFGNTYVATNVEFDEVVAIKEFFIKGVTERDANNTTVSVSNSENKNLFEEQLQKFKKEARRLRKLKNPHIVSVHDLFEENGTAYYVMDDIDGENLSVRLKRLQQPLSEKEVMGYLPQILEALKCVHEEQLYHLDLKPANIMVDRQGNVTLIDFGASKQRSSVGGATTSTAVSFTNGFAPREQMEQNLDKFGPWTDLYALGATLYNLLTNKKPPLPSDIDDDRSSDKHIALPMPQSISEKTKQLILYMLTTDRLDRPQSMDKVKEMIENVEHGADENTVVIDVNEETEIIGKETNNTVSPPITSKPIESEPIKPLANESEQISSENNMSENEVEEESKNYTQKIIRLIILFLLFIGLIGTISLIGTIGFFTSSNDSTPKQEDNEVYVSDIEYLKFTNELGSFIYSGKVNKDNIPDGNGEATFDNGNYYFGFFKNGNLDGENGRFKFKNGDTFVGSFKDNYFNEGTYTVAETGEYFRGTFKDGNPYKGTWYDKNAKVLETVK